MGANTNDPRIPESVVTHHLAGDQFDVIVNGIAMLVTELRLANGPRRPADAGPEPAPVTCGHEPWTFHDPRQKCDVTAFIDDRNQIRHVPLSRLGEVPGGWRRVFLAAA